MIKGSCLCGAIRFELDRAPDVMNLCHCSMCRKITGAAFGVFAHTTLANFRWTEGGELMTRYESSPGNWRVFCSTCGSLVPSCDESNAHVCIPAGSFDDDPQIAPAVQIFAGSKASWYDIALGPPSFEEFAPDDFFDD